MSAKRKNRRVVATGTTNVENQNEISSQELANGAVQALEIARKIIEKLAQTRIQNKMTASRATAVGKELKELVKVISIYR